MAAVTQTIPNFLGGVSKQTDVKKQPGQLRECLNAYPDPTFGLMKRPGFKFIDNIYTPSAGTDPELKDAKWFFIKRDNLETYIGCILDKDDSNHTSKPIRIWNRDGTECTVTFESSPADAKLYLDTTRDNYDILTVQDTSIITNKTKEVTAQTAPTSHISDSKGTVRIKTVAYSIKYEVNLKVGSTDYNVNFTTLNAEDLPAADNSTNPSTEKFNTAERILKELKGGVSGGVIATVAADGEDDASRTASSTYALTGLSGSGSGTGAAITITVDSDGGPTYAVVSGGTQFKANETIDITDSQVGSGGGEDFKITVATASDHFNSGLKNLTINPTGSDLHVLTVDQLDASLELELKNAAGTAVAFELTTTDSQGGIHIDCYTEQVKTQADLTAQSNHGRLTKVVNLGGESDTFWLKFFADNDVSGRGSWEETKDPTVSDGMDAATLPHELFNSASNTFVFRQPKKADGTLAWKDRVVGDTVTNSYPSFVGATIQQACYHNNRRGFLTEDNVSMSKSNDFFNFYFTSALTATDDDAIDINCSSIRPAVLHAVLPTAQGLILFSRNQQFIMFSDAEILTPSSAVIRGISNYEMDPTIDPVDVGTTINFVSKTPSYTRIFGMQTRGSEESPVVMDIGKVVSEWVPDTVNNLLSSPQNSLIALYGDNRSAYEGDKNIYMFKTYNVGDKIIMQAWFKWDLPGNIQFAEVDSDTMWSVVEDDGKYHLISASLTQTPEETIMTTADGQQINPHMDMYIAANNGEVNDITTFTSNAATETARTPGTYNPAAHTKGASFRVVVADAGSGVGGAVTVTKLTSGSGYAVNDTITLASANIGGGTDITITVTAVNEEKKVVYDTAGDFSKCYIPYADLTALNPVILIAGNASQDFAGVTEYGFTVNPTRATDSDGTYFKVTGKDLASQADNVYVGYQYNYDVELPKTYFRLGQEGAKYDYTANLTIARMKFAVGLSSVVGFKVKSKGYRGELKEYVGGGDSDTDVGAAGPPDTRPGKSVFTVPFPLKTENGIVVKVDGAKQDINTAYTVTTTDAQATVTFLSGYVPLKESTAANVTTPAQKIEITTDTWYDVQTAQELGQYLADDVPLTDSSVFTIPIHQRSDNFNIRVFSNSPFPVALTSMMWEGQYSPRFYRRT